MNVRVRFAPSPTGPLHMGGVRTALYNYLFAKQHKGTFILRIEDTDQSRFVPRAEGYINEALQWCGILPDESPDNPVAGAPYRQSERKDIYKPYAQQLIDDGNAYYAFDTPEELESMRQAAKEAGSPNWQYNHITRLSMRNSLSLSQTETERLLQDKVPYVVRIKLNRNEDIKVQDRVRGWVQVNTTNMDDKVLFKSDGLPTYHLANVVDDHLMGITHVIRGEEWLPSLPLHVKLYQYLGWEESQPEFAHLPLILKPDGKGKLSKRDGDRLGFPVFPLRWDSDEGDSFPGYREQGYLPEGFVNMLAFLGWNPGTEQEIFSMKELIDIFSLAKVHKAGAKFDPAKTRWFNQQHLRQYPISGLASHLSTQLRERKLNYEQSQLPQIIGLIRDRAYVLHDLLEESLYFFEQPKTYDENTVAKKWNDDARKHLEAIKQHFTKLEPFDRRSTEQSFKAYLTENALGFGKVGPALRLALTGKAQGPSLFDICEILGRHQSLRRITHALNSLP